MRSLGSARRSQRVRWVAGVLSGALLATSVATTPGAGAEPGDDTDDGVSAELTDRLEGLGEDPDVEAPEWEDSPSAPIAVPEVPEEASAPEPEFPTPGTLEQSLDAAAAELDASADRPVVLRPIGGTDADDGDDVAPEPDASVDLDESAGRDDASSDETTEAPETAGEPVPAGEEDGQAEADGGETDIDSDAADGDAVGREPAAESDDGAEDLPDEADTSSAVTEDDAADEGRTSDETENDADPVADAGRAEAESATDDRSAETRNVSDLEVTVLDRDVAEAAGVTGFAFTVEAKGGPTLDGVAARGGHVPVEMEIDYSGFASAYGGGFADRLRVVALPGCVVEDPVPASCNVHQRPLETRNLHDEETLVVEMADLAGLAAEGAASRGVDPSVPGGDGPSAVLDPDVVASEMQEQTEAAEADLSAEIAQGDPETAPVPDELAPFESTASGPVLPDDAVDAEAPSIVVPDVEARAGAAAGSDFVVLAVTSGVGGDTGTFGATSLSPTGQWNVATGSGEFSWSYPIDVPAPPGGSAPSVGLGYSSGAVDGLTNATNTQGSQNGLGFGDFANAFIERSYEPCVNAMEHPSQDLCWIGHGSTISLEGVGGPLVPLDSDAREWRVQNDPGWIVERIGDPGQPVDGQVAPEYWKVTGPDGTQYFFGRNQNPDTSAQTNSNWWVPVTSDHPGDPCYGNIGAGSPGSCAMTWRWNLDRVVDPHGNVTTYTYAREYDRYAGWLGIFPRLLYVRGGMLSQITYGAKEGGSGTPAARVTFGRQYRCVFVVENCPQASNDNPGGFPDVPVDLICGNQSPCPSTAPSFFSTRRYAHVRTEVRDSTASGGWRMVAQHNLIHQFKGEQDAVNCMSAANHCKLYLSQVQHVGLAGGLSAYPTTNLGYAGGFLANRVDTHEGPAMRHHRVTRVRNPLGGLMVVTYGRTNPCSTNYTTDRWDQHAQDCFPQSIVENGFRRRGLFNKWSVVQVTDNARHGSPAMTTEYEYEGDPAWGFDWGAFSRNDQFWGWSSWRGYDTTRITQGNSTSRVRSFRGMDGDPVLHTCPGSSVPVFGCKNREEQVSTIDGSLSYDDDRILMGRSVEEESYGTVDDVPDQIVESTRYTYEIRETATPVDDSYSPTRWAGVHETTERTATAPGQFRERGSRTTYNANQQPESTEELGWLDVTGDERCSTTTYADNPDLGMFVYPSQNTVTEGTCANPGATLSSQVTLYDGAETVAPPTKGDVTMQRTLLDTSDTWAESTTTFDDLGRPFTVTDPDGNTTTTSYVPAASSSPQVPREVTVANALGHESVAELMVEFGVPLREEDPNGFVTTYAYDHFGRTTRVRQPTEQPYVSGDQPSWQYSYHLSNDYSAPPVVRSRRLTSNAKQGAGVVLEDMWNIYDGYGRDRQTHMLSPESGKVIVDATTYDSQGRVRDDIVPQAQPGQPGAGILNATPFTHRTRYQYDEIGRTVAESWIRDGANGTPVHATTYEHGPDSVTVTGPEGNQVRETIDGMGNTVEVAEHDGSDWVTTSYGYDLAGNLTSVTDPEGHVISYTYDLAGRRTGQSDPNRGAASYTYDVVGNPVTATDANGDVIHTSYDELGRPTERREDDASGTLLASWTYDAPGEAGMLDKSVRHDATGDWVSDVTGYDARGRATGATLTVPAGIPGLSGDYTVSQVYDRADKVVAQQVPAVGGLPAETISTGYNVLGMPTGMSSVLATLPAPSAETYVRSTGYDDRGRRTQTAYGPQDPAGPGGLWMVKMLSYNDDQQLSGVEVYNTSSSPNWSTPVVRHELGYDQAGLVVDRTSQMAMLGSWRECYGFDARSRLTDAHTVSVAETCEEGTAGGGSQGYEHSYTYSPGNRLVERTQDGETTQHSYRGPGQSQPYAPVQVGDVTFEWDANGNLTESSEGGETEEFVWDAEQRLRSVSDGDSEASFVYDTDGQRVLRTTDEGSTLYFAGHEVTASTDGSTVTAVRSYSFAGELVATRTPAGVDYLVTDERGSVEAVAPSGGAPSYDRAYEPYGGELAADGQEPETDRGFLGQVEDDSTGLSYLNARYYNAEAAVFLSPDPVYDTGNIKSLNPYTYSLGSPTAFSDASGLSPSYTLGVEQQNWSLRLKNRQLVGHIGYLGGQIDKMQNIIRDQQNAITSLLADVAALEAIVRQQNTTINKLNARVASLTRQVNYWRGQAYYWRNQAMYWKNQAVYWRGQAMYWKGQAAYWKGRAMYWRGKALYYRGVIGDLVGIAFLPQYRGAVLASIDRGAGVPMGGSSFAGGIVRTYQQQVAVSGWSSAFRSRSVDNRSGMQASQLSHLQTTIQDLNDTIEGIGGGGGGGMSTSAYCEIHSKAAYVAAAADVAAGPVLTDGFTDAADAAWLASGYQCVWGGDGSPSTPTPIGDAMAGMRDYFRPGR